MDAFDEQNGAFGDVDFVSAVFAHAGFEVVGREVDDFACESALEVGVEEGEVEGVEAFVVVFAVFVAGRVVAVDEVVVERNHLRFHQARHQLDGEPLCGGGFSGG